MRGVDVSYFNGSVDWQAVKSAGYDFAICRPSYGKKHFDETFQRNVEQAPAIISRLITTSTSLEKMLPKFAEPSLTT